MLSLFILTQFVSMKSDIIIVGGGASGLLAAIGAARTLARSENGGTVTVLEKMQKAGRKLMLTGKGRCNFTNLKSWDDFSAHIRTHINFVSPAWHNLTPEALVELFKENGLRSVVERGDRAYPASMRAGDVVDTLVRTATLYGVKIVTGCEVHGIEALKNGFRLNCTQTSVKEFRPRREEGRDGRFPARAPQPVRTETTITQESHSCSRLIIATGGLSYPGSGSTGDGFKWAEQFGHSVEPLFPALTALVPEGYKTSAAHPLAAEIKEAFRSGKQRKAEDKVRPLPEDYPKYERHIERMTPMTRLGSLLEGNSLENVQATLTVDGNEVQSEFGDLDFTDGGIEGPVGFQLSRRAVKALINGSKVSLRLDLKPAVELEQLDADVHARWDEVRADPRSRGVSFQRLFRILLGKLIPWDLTAGFLECHPQVSVNSLADALKNWHFEIEGFVGFERSVITAGGISTDEVTAKTLESKKQAGLYFTGEVLDMDADTGGYNLQLAFATGLLAGESAAKSL